MPQMKDDSAMLKAEQPQVSLGDIEVVYADSRTALEAAWAQGLARTAEIRTSSPHLLMDPDLGAVASDGEFTPARLQQIRKEIPNWARALYQDIASDPNLADLAVVVARRATRFQTQIYKIMALKEEDFHRPVAVINFDVANPYHKRIMTPPITKILKAAPQYREILFPADVQTFERPIEPPPASFRDRFQTATWATKAYRAALNFWSKMPFRSPRGTILIFSENSLIKETAYELATRGYGLLQIRGPKPDSSGALSDAATAMLNEFPAKISAQFKNWMVPSAVQPAVEYLMSDIELFVSEFESALDYWRKYLADLKHKRPRMVMMNLVHWPDGSALCVAAREIELLSTCFQHGVSREIGLVGDRDEIWYETLSTDIYFTHTEEAAQITNDSPLTKGNAIAIGLEDDFRRAGRLKPTGWDAPPIWYISTMLHIGNFQGLYAGVRDLDQTKFEIGLIDQVFTHLPHRVMHKPYPFSRYPDADPINDRARQAPNLEIYEELKDLRYLLRDARVLVTWGATSTIAVCVMSGKPTITIVHPGKPLSPTAHESLSKGMFVFDSSAPNFFQDLRAFLSRPIETIESEWMERSAARTKTIKEFFDVGGTKAGRIAADMLQRTGFDPGKIFE